MTTRNVVLQIPVGHCRRCRQTARLANPKRPAISRNGQILSSGECPSCGTIVTCFYSASELQVLPSEGLPPVVVASLGVGMRAGVRAARGIARRERGAAMVRLQDQGLSLAAIGLAFGMSRWGVCREVAEARREEREGRAGYGKAEE